MPAGAEDKRAVVGVANLPAVFVISEIAQGEDAGINPWRLGERGAQFGQVNNAGSEIAQYACVILPVRRGEQLLGKKGVLTRPRLRAGRQTMNRAWGENFGMHTRQFMQTAPGMMPGSELVAAF